MGWRDFDYKPPIAVKGGIKAHSKRGAFAANWWARRWIAVLEALNLGGRLQRGRNYARRGQVIELTIEAGTVRASVQGSRSKPYAIAIGIKPFGKPELKRLAAELSKSPYVLAKLVAREMPQDIERFFETMRFSLFPARASELHTDCSCPDWSNPCKHIAAVYYLLGEEFDRDPFLIFRLRGIDIDSLLQPVESGVIEKPAPAIALSENFWEGARPEVDLTLPEAPLRDAPLLRRLGSLPFWRGEQSLVESLEPAYTAASAAARKLFVS
jgi:uncharacterized Zn finger protein